MEQKHNGSGDNIAGDKIINNHVPIHKVPQQLTTTLGEFPNFKGRKKDCIKLTKKLNEHKAVVVHGIGGIGKSSFVSAYLDMHKNEFKYYGFINWTDNIKFNFFNSLQVNMKLEDYSDTDKNFDEVLRQLRDLDGQKLLIIDRIEEKEVNYREEEKFIRDILTLIDNDYKIIFTSRFKIKNLNPYPLNSLDKEEAKEIFLTHYKKNAEIEKVYEILQYLDYHPLFVKLVAETLEVTDFSIDTIIQKFDKGELSKIEFIDEYTMDTTSFNKNLKALFSMQKINEDGLCLLKQFSVLPSIGIEFTFLQQILNKDELLRNKLNVLSNQGWLISDKENYKLHQIIKEYIISEHFANFNEIRSIFDYFFKSLEKISDSQIAIENKNNYSYFDNLAKILKLIEKKNSYLPLLKWSKYNGKISLRENIYNFNIDYKNNISLVATFFDNLGIFYQQFNNYKKAEQVYKISLKLRKIILGDNHFITSISYHNLGGLYNSIGEYKEAEEFYQKALIIQKKEDKEHPWTATSYDSLGILYKNIGNYEKAESFTFQALKIRESVLDSKHLNIVSSYNNLALIYETQGKYEESLKLFEKSLNITKEKLGEEHPSTATSYNTLAGIYESMGKYEKAKELFLKALDIRQRIWGEKHRDIYVSMHNLANTYTLLGNYQEAEKLYNKSLKMSIEILGETHHETVTSYDSLANLFSRIGDYKQAELLYVKSLKIREEKLGINHESTAISYNNIGQCYQYLGEFKKAKVFLEKSLTILKKIWGDKHQNIATSYDNLSTFYEIIKDYKNAKRFSVKALKLKEELLGKEHPLTASSYHQLAGINRLMGNYNSVETLFIKSLKIREKKLGIEHLDTANTYNNFGLYYLDIQFYKKAEFYLKKSLKIREIKLGDKHFDLISSNNNLAELYKLINDYTNAERYSLKALEVAKQVLGEDNDTTITFYYHIGWFYYNKINDIDKAYNHIKKYIELLKKKSSLTLQSHLNISVSYFILKKYKESLTHIKKIIELKSTCLDEFDRDMIISLLEIVSSNDKVGESLIGEIINRIKI